MLVGSAVQSLNAAFSQQGLLYAAWHRACADQPVFPIEGFCRRRAGHADRLLKEDAGFEQVCVECAAGLRNEPIWVAQQGKCAVKAFRRWYAEHGLHPRCVFLALTLTRLVRRRAEAVPEQ